MKENAVLRGVILAAVAVLVLTGPVLAADIEVTMTPNHLSLSIGEVRFVRCNVSSEYWVGSTGGSLSVDGADAIWPVKVESHIEEHDTTVVFFFVDDVQDMLSEAGAMGEVYLTLTVARDAGDLIGIDTITVTE